LYTQVDLGGSEDLPKLTKDIEDARFLFRLFKNELDARLLTTFFNKIRIPNECIEKYLDGINGN